MSAEESLASKGLPGPSDNILISLCSVFWPFHRADEFEHERNFDISIFDCNVISVMLAVICCRRYIRYKFETLLIILLSEMFQICNLDIKSLIQSGTLKSLFIYLLL